MEKYNPPMRVKALVRGKGNICEVLILEKTGANQYIAEYDGVKCTAMFNMVTGLYYLNDVDD